MTTALKYERAFLKLALGEKLAQILEWESKDVQKSMGKGLQKKVSKILKTGDYSVDDVVDVLHALGYRLSVDVAPLLPSDATPSVAAIAQARAVPQ